MPLPGAGGGNDPKNILISVIYEQPSEKVLQRQKEINERNRRAEAAKQLPQGGIEYIDIPEKK